MDGESRSEGPKPGDRIGERYEVTQVLGVGGMGVVVAARHLELGHQVAVKMLLPSGMAAKEAVGRFLREGQAAAALTSEHAVRVLDFGKTAEGAPFLVMEFLRGRDLGAVLEERGPLPLGEVAAILLQACEAIAEAHERGIVHRDLKPSNLFLVDRPGAPPMVKVLDFGISKFVDNTDEEQNLTGTRTTLGTPLYMSPEQVRNAKRVDQRTDVWALGVLLQELLTGRPPFEGSSFSGLCAAIMVDAPTSVRASWPGVPPEVESLLARCLEKDASRRLGSVREFAAALRPLVGSPLPSASRLAISPATSNALTLQAPPSTPPGPPSQSIAPSLTTPLSPESRSSLSLVGVTAGDSSALSRRGKAPLLVLGAGALLALLTGGALLGSRSGSQGKPAASAETSAEPNPLATAPTAPTAPAASAAPQVPTVVPVASAAQPTPPAASAAEAQPPATAWAGKPPAGKTAPAVTKGPAKGYSPANDDRK